MRILIAGGGQVGYLVASRLVREGNDITIIEENADRCLELDEMLDAKIVRGSATSIQTLDNAGLDSAEMLIAVTNDDHINFLVCLIAQVRSKVEVKVARIRSHDFEHWKQIARDAGLQIDLIIHPETEIAERILRVVRVPGVSELFDFAEGQVKLFGMNIDQNSWLSGKTVEDLERFSPPEHSLIAMIFRGSQVVIPHGAERLLPGDHVYVVTKAENLSEAYKFMGIAQQESLERVFIIGGKQVGIWVAEQLEAQGIAVKLFEKSASRCERISQLLRKTIVIHGDGTDEGTLMEENIEGVNAFLALTGDDEDNIIASLLARKLGAEKVVALINRLNYLPLVQRLGINTSVSSRLAVVDRALQFVRKGRVLSVTTFREIEAEAIELIAEAGSKYVGKTLRELRLPRGAIVGAIARPGGEVIVPRGGEKIEAGDRVTFFASENTVPELESAFLVEPRRKRA